MKAAPYLLSLLLCSAGDSNAAEPITVLGLPLGGKITPPLKACRDLPPGKYMQQGTCWVYSTAGPKGGRSGELHIPGADSRPAWAAYADFRADVDQNGTLTQFTVISRDANQADEIINSISTRFGPPAHSNSNPPFKWYANWTRPEIGISFLCNIGNKCHTRFTSAEVASEERARLQKQMKLDAARPVSP